MEGILHAASEVKELLVHEAEKLHLHGNNDLSSSSSSSDEEDESAEKFPRIESAVVVLNDKLSSSSSSSSSDEGEEEAPAQDPVALTKSEVAGESYEAETNRVDVEEPELIVESELSESDEKVLPIEEEEETLVAADSLETSYLLPKETEDSPPENIPAVESGSGSADEIPVSSGSPVLITTVTRPTSWMSCCGLFDVFKPDR